MCDAKSNPFHRRASIGEIAEKVSLIDKSINIDHLYFYYSLGNRIIWQCLT